MPATKKNATTAASKAAVRPSKPIVARATPTAPAKPSALDAAVQVLRASGGPMTTKELIGTMAAQGLWASPNGKTPAATLSAALQREVTTKGAASRFKKTGPGRFAATGAGGTDAAPAKAPKPKAAAGARPKATKRATVPKPAAPAAPTVPNGTPGPEGPSALFRI